MTGYTFIPDSFLVVTDEIAQVTLNGCTVKITFKGNAQDQGHVFPGPDKARAVFRKLADSITNYSVIHEPTETPIA